MRQKIVGFLGACLFLFCVIMVVWQVWEGTLKYMSSPVASKVYTKEAEIPVITVCHEDDNLKIKTLHKLSFNRITKEGIFKPDLPVNMSFDEVIEEAMNHYYYLLDFSGNALSLLFLLLFFENLSGENKL